MTLLPDFVIQEIRKFIDEAVDIVCARSHKVDGQELDVKIYYECLGQVESEDELCKTVASCVKARDNEQPDNSELAMSQHYVDCGACGSYSKFYCNSCHKRLCEDCRDEHIKHPDNTKHEVCNYEDRKLTFNPVPCKLHPKHHMVLCCKKCNQAICALCTTKDHAEHGFSDLEEVYTENYRKRIEHIRRIRDVILPQSRQNLHESQNATLEAKENLVMMKTRMKAQASRIKRLVDDILSENLQNLQTSEGSTVTVEKLEKQEKGLNTYVSEMETLLEKYKTSISPTNPIEFLAEMKNTPIVDLEPVPEVSKIVPGNFSDGKLNKEEIRKQFGTFFT